MRPVGVSLAGADHELRIQLMPSPAANIRTAMRQLIGPDMLFEVLDGIERRTRFEHHHAQATLSQHLSRGAASRARSDNANVVDLPCRSYLGQAQPPQWDMGTLIRKTILWSIRLYGPVDRIRH